VHVHVVEHEHVHVVQGGSGMARDGVDALTVRAKDLLQSGVLMAAPHAEPDVRVGYFAVAANGVDLGLVGADDGGYAPFYGYPRCPRPANFTKVFSISRNPFEITVSEMAYDVDGGEVYGNQIPSSIWGDATACSVTSGKSIPQYCDGLQQVSVAMRSYLKGVLPPPSSTLTTCARRRACDSNVSSYYDLIRTARAAGSGPRA
jgi:hypothetical protein